MTNYGIYFTTDNDLPIGSFINITFPSEYYNFTTPLACFSIKNIGSQLVCTLTNSTQIKITKGFQSVLVAGSEIGIKLQNIKNPTQSVPNNVIND